MDGKKIKTFFWDNIGFVITVIVCTAYVALSLFTIDRTGKTVGEILLDGALFLLLSLVVDIMLTMQGTLLGGRNETLLATRQTHGEIVERITPYINQLDKWCDKRNEEALKANRTRYLASHGLKYSEYYDDEANFLGYNEDKEKLKSPRRSFEYKTEKARLKAVKKSLKLEITPLTTNSLTGGDSKADDPYAFSPTRQEYLKKKSGQAPVIKIVFAIVVGLYSAKLLEDINYGEVIWAAFQVAYAFVLGIIDMYKAMIFMTDDFRNGIIQKINILEKFERAMKNSATQETYEQDREKL